MHPAFSVIFFTVSSGAGYGLLALLGFLGPLGLVSSDPLIGAVGLGIAFIAITAGLVSSSAHLGHPERAWRAFSQWRTSWLSREGVAAVVTYGPALMFAYGWAIEGRVDGLYAVAGLLSAVLAIITVISTGMIYASLKTIHQWHNSWTVPGYVVLALASGFVWLNFVLMVTGGGSSLLSRAAVFAVAAAVVIKIIYWKFIDNTRHAATPESATGLGHLGQVKPFEGPHTETNYLLDEMGYRVARKHALKLRRIVLLFGFIGAMACMALTVTLMESASAGALPLSLLAALLVTGGALIERWLFFAEARHVVTLYYGAERV